VSYDIIVLGGGPAGSVVARRLASAGGRVLLVSGPRRSGLEGVSERTREMLVAEGIEAAEIAGPFERQGVWGGRPVVGREWLIQREHLAGALRERAAAAGAEVCNGYARRTWRAGDAWHLALRDGREFHGKVMVEARGRRGAEHSGPRLLALGSLYRVPHAGGGETRIEAAGFGWCWWARRGADLWVQVVSHPSAQAPRESMAAAIAQLPELARALAGASPAGPMRGSPAHARLGAGRAAKNLWYAGDAAVALDPLSGQGIYQSLSSARLVAAAIRSVAEGGELALAQRFIDERHADDFLRGVRIAGAFYRESAAHGPFWTETATGYQAVHRAHRPDIQGLRIERRPVLIDDRIVEREVVISAAHPRGVWQVSGVPAAELVHGKFRRSRADG
jgi:menaquinone-9 beta-reductase